MRPESNERWFEEEAARLAEAEKPPEPRTAAPTPLRLDTATRPRAVGTGGSQDTVDRLLEEVTAYVRRFVVLTSAQLDAVALWVLHTHALEAADTTPYLALTSAEKRSGKTRLLEVLELLVRSPLPTANISDAALFRAVAEFSPTLLLDEVDAIFGPRARDREDLRGMLNAGYRRGAVTHRMGGPKMTTLEQFPVFCAKVFAGIGRLPDTIEDRSIRVRLERKTRDEPTQRFRRRDVEAEAETLRFQISDWAESAVDSLRDARPVLPDELDDRAQDVWEPLLAIAESAGAQWPVRARESAVELSTGEAREDEALGVRLLADIRSVFAEAKGDRLSTFDLLTQLNRFPEAPWGNWRGRPMQGQTLAAFLKEFGIRSRTIWLGTDNTPKGYLREQFDPVWLRYLGDRDARPPGAASETGSRLAESPPGSRHGPEDTDARPPGAARPEPAPETEPGGLAAAGGVEHTDEEIEQHFARLYPGSVSKSKGEKRRLVLAVFAAERDREQRIKDKREGKR